MATRAPTISDEPLATQRTSTTATTARGAVAVDAGTVTQTVSRRSVTLAPTTIPTSAVQSDPLLPAQQAEIAAQTGAPAINPQNIAPISEITGANVMLIQPVTIQEIVNKPGGTTTGEIQYLVGNSFVADPDFKYDSPSDTLLVNGSIRANNLTTFGKVNLGYISNIAITGGTANQIISLNADGTLKWINQSPPLTYSNSNVASYLTSTFASYLNNYVPGYRGNLTVNKIAANSITVTSANLHITGGANGQTLQTDGAGNLTFVTPSSYGNGDVYAYMRTYLPTNAVDVSGANIVASTSLRTTELIATGQVNLGNVANVHINGGASNQVLATDGSGNLSWVSQDKLRNELAGSNTEIQFNDANVHGASANLTFNKATNTFTTDNVVANNITLGNATESVRNEFWFKAATHSTANSVILVMPSANIAGLDVTIVATEGTNARKISKILVATLGSVTNHSEYSTRYVGPNPGDFDVNQIGQNIALSVKPTTANTVVYNMIVTTYKD